MSDLRNIVDRLDLLMGSSAEASAQSPRGLETSAREQIEEVLSELSHRVGVVERETEELRTLVNHLMTIATWQAKVTATLVGEEADDAATPDEQDEDLAPPVDQQLYSPPPSSPPPAPPDQPSFVDRVGKHVEPRGGDEPDRHRRQAPSSLDDDIDDILGTNREPSSEVGPPPDFGI